MTKQYPKTADELAEYYRERCQRLEAFMRDFDDFRKHCPPTEIIQRLDALAFRCWNMMRDLGIEETKG